MGRSQRLRCKLTHYHQCVFDSTWEASEAYTLDRDPHVQAWAKNDHLGFEVVYLFNGVVRKYRPDFLVRLANGAMLVLEVKGQDSAEHRAKRQALEEWVAAVNMHGGFGTWAWDVSRDPADVTGILRKHAPSPAGSR
jgi:type III restriction enzyme